jgi:hypothetical protein
MWYAVCRFSVAGFIAAATALFTLGNSSIKAAAMHPGASPKKGIF